MGSVTKVTTGNVSTFNSAPWLVERSQALLTTHVICTKRLHQVNCCAHLISVMVGFINDWLGVLHSGQEDVIFPPPLPDLTPLILYTLLKQ